MNQPLNKSYPFDRISQERQSYLIQYSMRCGCHYGYYRNPTSEEPTELVPIVSEIHDWVLHTTKHVCHIEYYLDKLGVGDEDPQRPHDIVGPGNKYEWDVMWGFALQYRGNGPEFFSEIVMPSLELHRTQFHHRMWNQPNPNASEDNMLLGAIDAVCSLREPRSYQGGIHTWNEVVEITNKNPPHKVPWMLQVIPVMKDLPAPGIDVITLDYIPNLGLPDDIYYRILHRVAQVKEMLAYRGYDLSPAN